MPSHQHSTQFAPHLWPLTSNQGYQSRDGLLVNGGVEGFWAPSHPETHIGGIVEVCRDCAGGGCEGAMGLGPGGGGGAGAPVLDLPAAAEVPKVTDSGRPGSSGSPVRVLSTPSPGRPGRVIPRTARSRRTTHTSGRISTGNGR
jgi:hypothetical protein